MHDFKREHFKFRTFSAACCVQEVSVQIFFWLFFSLIKKKKKKSSKNSRWNLALWGRQLLDVLGYWICRNSVVQRIRKSESQPVTHIFSLPKGEEQSVPNDNPQQNFILIFVAVDVLVSAETDCYNLTTKRNKENHHRIQTDWYKHSCRVSGTFEWQKPLTKCRRALSSHTLFVSSMLLLSSVRND